MRNLRTTLIFCLASSSLLWADWKKDAKQCASETDPDAAIQFCTAVINSKKPPNGDLAVAFYNRGIAYAKKSDYDHAIQDFDQATRFNPTFADAFSARGDALNNKGEYDLAIRDYSAALQLNPTDARSLADRGLAHDNKGEYDQAIQDFSLAIQTTPNYAFAFYSRGFVYSERGQHDQAIQDFGQALQLNPKYVEALEGRGAAYKNTGNYDLAIQDYTHAIQLAPDSAEAINGRGDVYSNQGNYDAAFKDFNQAIQLNSNYAEAFSNRGYTWYKKGDLLQAGQDYEQAIKLDPNDPEALRRRGDLNLAQGNYWSATRDFDQAINLKPGFPDGLFGRGLAHFYQGDFSPAQQDFAQISAYPYPALWLYLAQARAGQEARSALANDTAKVDLKVWPGPVISYFLGNVSADEVLAAAKDPNPQKDREQHCEAYFYLAEQALAAGKQADANRLFRSTLDTRITTFVEYNGAKAELHGFAARAFRQCSDERNKQAKANGPALLQSCSDAVESGALSGETLAKAYSYRAEFYATTHDTDRAIADYSQAINLRSSKNDASMEETFGDAMDALTNPDIHLADLTNSLDVYANAFAFRGAIYAGKGDFDRAIQDYDQAVQMDSKFAKAFDWRAQAYVGKGNYTQAVRDYDQAIQLNQGLSGLFFWYQSRGIAYFYLGDYAAAESDFTTEMKALPNPYSAILLYLSRARSGQDAHGGLVKNSTGMNLTSWPGPIVKLFLGTATPESVLEAAKSTKPATDRQQRCQAYFYLGQQALIAGKPVQAKSYFKQALALGNAGCSDEFTGAKVELGRAPTS